MPWERAIVLVYLFSRYYETQGSIASKGPIYVKMCKLNDHQVATGRGVVISLRKSDPQSRICTCNASSSVSKGRFTVTLVAYRFRRRRACEGEVRFNFPKSQLMSRRFCAGKSGNAFEPVKVATLRDGNVVITMTQKKPFYTALHIFVSGPRSDVMVSCAREGSQLRHTPVTAATITKIRHRMRRLRTTSSVSSSSSHLAVAGVACIVVSTIVAIFMFNRKLKPPRTGRNRGTTDNREDSVAGAVNIPLEHLSGSTHDACADNADVTTEIDPT